MQFSVTFLDTPLQRQDTVVIEEKLSEGNYPVYQVSSSLNSTKYALKLFPKSSSDSIQYQKEQLGLRLAHPNIIKHIPVECEHSSYHAHFTELARFGDFHTLLTRNILNFNETLIRTFFHQVVEGIEYAHSQGIAHLDLKLENMVLGSDYNLKIIDFDKAQLIEDAKMTSGGTPVYRAPEVLMGTCKDLVAVDVYALGIILYAFKTGEFPFMERCNKLGEVKRSNSLFFKNNQEFWKAKSQLLAEKVTFSEEFIELINGMLEAEPTKRMKIQDIKNSKWYNSGPVLSNKSIQLRTQASLASLNLQKWSKN